MKIKMIAFSLKKPSFKLNMRFSKKIVANISLLIVGTGIGFTPLVSHSVLAQMSEGNSKNSTMLTQKVTSLENTAWQLTSLGDAQPLAEKPITLEFGENNHLSGSSGCNRYMGSFSTKGNQFSVKSPLGSTMMACPDDLMKQEQQFLQALSAGKSYKINANGELEIQYREGSRNKQLKFSPLKTSSAEQKMTLENTSWQLMATEQSLPKTERPITLTFSENNRLAGSSGCNRYMGSFKVTGNQFEVKSPLASTRMACPEVLMKREKQFLEALSAAKSYQINAKGELEIQYGSEKGNNILRFSPTKTSEITEKIIYVNGRTVPCTGVAPQECWQIKESMKDDWTLLYHGIKGFKYEPGYVYKLRVREEIISNPPADGSSREWVLVEVLEKTAMKVQK
jgi:heat shock protein HslJ